MISNQRFMLITYSYHEIYKIEDFKSLSRIVKNREELVLKAVNTLKSKL